MEPASPARDTGVDNYLEGDQPGSGPNSHDELAEAGHNDGFAQPHDVDTEGLVAAAEANAALISTEAEPMGHPGRPWDRRAPFWVGMAGAAGVAVTIGLVAP